eukprot:992865-Rhodomonas_salina.1
MCGTEIGAGATRRSDSWLTRARVLWACARTVTPWYRAPHDSHNRSGGTLMTRRTVLVLDKDMKVELMALEEGGYGKTSAEAVLAFIKGA